MARFKAEDLHVLAGWLQDIIRRHCGYINYIRVVVEHHRRLRGHEVDLLVTCWEVDFEGNQRGRKKTILVELKENKLEEVLEQALARRPLADYVYAAVNLPAADILSWMARHGLAKDVLAAGVGVVSIRDNLVLFRSYSRQNVNWAEASSKITTLLSYIPIGGESSG